MKGRVLIRRFEDQQQFGSIIVPFTTVERPQKGLVLAVGEGVESLWVGDCVLFQPWSDSQLLRFQTGDEFLASITPNIIVAKVFIDPRDGELVILPYLDRVSVIPAQPKNETESGLRTPWLDKEHVLWMPFGEVDSVGPRCTSGLQTGDKVVIPQEGGVTVDVGTADNVPDFYTFGLFVFHEHEILATLGE